MNSIAARTMNRNTDQAMNRTAKEATSRTVKKAMNRNTKEATSRTPHINPDENEQILDKLTVFSGVDAKYVRNQFEYTDEWIDEFYCSLVDHYREMVSDIPDYASYTAGEKLANFFLTSMDLLRENMELVRSTYHPNILDRLTRTRFEQKVEVLFQEIISDDNRIASSSRLLLIGPFYTLLSREYLILTGRWLDQPELENTLLALIEKSSTLLNEFLYSGVVDKAWDLGSFVMQHGLLAMSLSPVSIARRFLRF